MSTNVGEIDLSLILNSDKFTSQLKNVDAKADTAATKLTKTLSKIGKAVGVAFSVAAVVKFGKECLNVATETSNAWIGLNSILTGQGKSFQQAKKFINDYISDGLVPLNNAVTTYKNLAARGYNSDQIQKTMIALKNSATFGRQSTYSLGEAVQTASEGLKNENSILVDNAGVTKNVAKMWEDYAKSIGKTTNQLTKQEKIQAEVNGILQETKFQSNDAAIYANTFSGKVAQLSQAFTTMKTSIGNVVQPILKLFIPAITTAVNAVTKLFTALAGLMSLFGLKADSVETVSNGIDGIAASAGDASDAIEGVGDSAKKAAKQANGLAAFDNLNVLKNDTGSDSSGSSGGSGGGAEIADNLNVSSVVEEDTTAFSKLIDRVKELAGIFKNGFKISFGDTNFDGILTSLNNIKNTILDIWTDPEVIGAANNYINAVIYSWGQTIGAVARIGINIAEGLLGSIDLYLSSNKDRIKNTLIQIFDLKAEWQRVSGNFYQALGEISDVFKSDSAKQIGANIIAMYANPIMSVSLLFQKFTNDIQALLLQPVIDNVNKIKIAIENTLKPIETITGVLAEAMTYVGDKWNSVYDEHIHPLMESIKTGLSDTFGKFLDAYNTYVAPALQRVADKFKELWDQHLKPFVDKVGEFVGSIADAITALWNGVLKPVIDWIIQNIIPVLVPIFEALWNTICNVFGSIADTIGGIIDTFRGLIDFIVGIFTGDWNKAWEGIKTFFSGIWTAIKGIVSTVWNAIKGIVDVAIKAVSGTIQTVLNAIKSIWNNIWNAIKTAASTIWTGIKTLISNAINNIKTNVSNVLNTIKTTWNTILTNIKTIATNIFNAVKTTITNIMNNIKTTISNVINAIKTTINTVLNAVKTIVTNIWTAIKTVIINTINNIKTNVTTIFNNIKSTISTILNAVKTTINTIWTSIKTIIINTINAIKTNVTNIFNSIKTTITNILNAIKSTISSIWNGIKSTISTAINSIKSNISNVFNSIKSSITNVFNNVKSSASSIWNSIKSNITSSVNGIKSNIVNAFSSAYNSIKSTFNNISSFFSGIWSRVRSTFSSLGTNIGNAISNSVKSGINGVISMIQNTINKAINLINGAINLINKLPGVNVGRISTLSLPRLAQGGYVKANTPQLAVIGDNKTHGEIVAPEDKLLEQNLKALKIFKEQEAGINNKADSGQTININFNGTLSQLIRALKPELDKEDKRKGTKLVIGGVS